MRFGIKTLDEAELKGKTVLCRVDMNQPVDREKGTLKSTNRIAACAPTVRELSDRGARVVLLAHQGSDIEYKNFYCTKPHAAVLLDNVRYVSEEQTLFEMKLKLTHEQQAKTLLVEKLAPLADLYVCDAFAAAHRDQPSLCGFEQVLPSYMGRLFEKEYCTVSQVMEAPVRPCVFVLGGAKISDAFLMMNTVLSRGVADKILTGGLVGNIFLTALGKEIGSGSVNFILKSNYGEYIDKAKELYARYGEKIVLPVDLAWVENDRRKEAVLGQVPGDITSLDIGSRTAEAYRNEILAAKTVFVNGPMGVFEQEPSELGTKAVWQALADTDGFTVLGGGDSITATEKYQLASRMGYICTGGGALIRFLTGEELPVVKALRHGAGLCKD